MSQPSRPPTPSTGRSDAFFWISLLSTAIGLLAYLGHARHVPTIDWSLYYVACGLYEIPVLSSDVARWPYPIAALSLSLLAFLTLCCFRKRIDRWLGTPLERRQKQLTDDRKQRDARERKKYRVIAR